MVFQERTFHNKRNRTQLATGTSKSTFLQNLKIESYTLATENDTTNHYALTSDSLKKVYDEFQSMMISAETPIQLIPIIIDNLNNTNNRIDGLGALASRDNVGSSQISSNAVGSSELKDNAVDTASIVDGAVTNSKITSINASKITAGTLETSRIPDLSASKITSGNLATARLPTGLVWDGSDFTVGSDGSVGLTVNDGFGNANLTFNHASGVPDGTGSSCRIESAVDGTTGALFFEIGNSTVSGTAKSLNVVHEMKTGYSRCHTNLGIKTNPSYPLDVDGYARATRFLIDLTTATHTPTYILGETGTTGYRYDWSKLDTFGENVPDLITLGNALLPEINIRGDAIRVSKDCANSIPCSSIHVHGTKILIGKQASESAVIQGLEFGVNISDNTDVDGELTANEVLTNKLHCPGLQMNYTLTGGSVVSFSAPNRGTSYLNWSKRIMAITVNVPNQALLGDFNVPGYIQIDMPPPGTRITAYILGDISTVTVGPAGIPMTLSVWFSLYYEFVPGTNGAVTDNSKFVLIDYSPNSRAPRINSNWILIATFNADDQSLKWMPGSRFLWPGTFYNSADGSYSMTGDIATADPSRTTGYNIIDTALNIGGEILLFNPIGVATSKTNEAISTTTNIIRNFFGLR